MRSETVTTDRSPSARAPRAVAALHGPRDAIRRATPRMVLATTLLGALALLPAAIDGRGERTAVAAAPETAFALAHVTSLGEVGVPWFRSAAQINGPHGVDGDGDSVWIADAFGRRLLHFGSNGRYLEEIGRAGLTYALGEVPVRRVEDVATRFRPRTPDDPAAPDPATDPGIQVVWWVDSGAHVAVGWDRGTGAYTVLGQVDTPGDTMEQLDAPTGIAVDARGIVFVSDTGNGRIVVYDPTLEPPRLSAFGFDGRVIDGRLDQPARLAARDGLLYVADAGNHRVAVFDVSEPSAPTFVRDYGEAGVAGADADHYDTPLGVGLDATFLYVADSGNCRVQVVRRTGGDVWDTIGSAGGCAGGGADTLRRPSDVALDVRGHVYVADPGRMLVHQFHPDRSVLRTFGADGTPYITDEHHLNAPSGLAAGPDGVVYVSERDGHRVLKFAADGSAEWVVGQGGVPGDGADGFDAPADLALDASGRLLVLERGAARIRILDAAGADVGAIGGPGVGDAEFDSPEGLGVAPDGRIAVADTGNHRVQILSAAGDLLGVVGSAGSPGAAGGRLDRPADAAFDAAGNLYVADTFNDRVEVFDAGLSHVRSIGRAGEPGEAFDRLRRPRGVAFDADGRLYVSDTGNARVQVFDARGDYLTTIGGREGAGSGGLREPLGVAVSAEGRVWLADSGNHRVQAFEAPRAPWEAAAVNGLARRHTIGLASLAAFGGELYAGTAVDAEVSGAPAGIWRAESGGWSEAVGDGLGDGSTALVADLETFDGRLFAAVQGWTEDRTPDEVLERTPTGGAIWSSADGDGWSVETGDLGGAGIAGAASLAEHTGQLYAGTFSLDPSVGAAVWRRGGGGGWTRTSPVGLDGSSSGNAAVSAMASFTGTLWAGTCHRTGPAQIWRSTRGDVWAPGGNGGATALGSGAGACVSAMAVFGDALYAVAGGGDPMLGLAGRAVEVWRCRRCDGTDWELANSAGMGVPGNRGRAALGIMRVPPFDFLYLAVGNAEGLEVWRTSDGERWEQSAHGGFGDGSNADLAGAAMAVHDGRLFVGTRNTAHGGELWATAGGRPEVVPTPGGGAPTPTPRPRTDPPTGRAKYERVDQWPAARVIPPDVIGPIPEMAIGDDGTVLMLDTTNQRIMRLGPDDRWLTAFGNTGFGAERLGQAGALAVDTSRDRVYVADHASERLVVYTLDGSFVAAWPQVYAVGIEVRADGTLWIADRVPGAVRHLAMDGTELARFGSYGDREDDQFVGLRDLTEDPDGNLFVLDLEGNRLRGFRPEPGGVYRRFRTLDLTGPRFMRGCGIGAGVRVTAIGPERLLLNTCIVEETQPVDFLPANHAGSDLYGVTTRTSNLSADLHVALATYDADRLDPDNDTWPVVVRYATGGFDIVARSVRGRRPDAASAAADGTIGGPVRLSTDPDGNLMVTDGYGLRRRAPDGTVLEDLPLVPFPSRRNPMVLEPELTIGQGQGGRVMGIGTRGGGRFARPVVVYGETELRRYCRAGRCAVNPYLVSIWETSMPDLTEGVAAVAHEPTRGQFVVLSRYHRAPSSRGIEDIAARLFLFDLGLGGRKTELVLPGEDRDTIWADVDAGPDGRILVLDTLNDRVQVFGPDGADLGLVPTPKDAWRVAGGPGGEIYVLTVYGHVVRMASDGTVLSRFVSRPHEGVPPISLVDLAVDASGWVYTIDELANQVTVFAPAGTEDDVLVGETCNLGGDKWVSPGDVLLGETAELFLTLFGSCGYVEQDADIVLAVNTFGMTLGDDPGRQLANNLRSARQIAALTDLDRHRLAVIAFATGEDVRTELTQDSYQVARALFSANAGLGDPQRNYSALKSASDRFDAESAGRRRVIVVVSPGADDDAGIAFAEGLKADGTLIVVVNGQSVIASGDLYDNVQVDPRAMGAGKPAHRRSIERTRPDVLVRTGQVVDELPDNIDYVPGSALPPATWDSAARTLTWDLADIGYATSVLSFRIRPSEEGEWPTNVAAWAEGVHGWDEPFRVDYPVPRIRVYGELPTPTPTPTATPEPIPTAIPQPIFLPVTVRQSCTPRDRNADVVLAIDTSGSMSETTGSGGPTKFEAAKAAARAFLAQLVPGRDQAALLQFNGEVTVIEPLSDDPAVVAAGLDRLSQAGGTRIDLALEAGRAELTSAARRPENNPVLIVLTDGEPTGTTPEEVRTAAAAAKAAGILVFTIGLGTSLDVELLRDVASRPEWAYLAPDTSDLVAIYEAIVVEIPCVYDWP